MVPVTQRLHADDLVVLLGAGASFEAGIPVSAGMIQELETLLAAKDGDWPQYLQLYNQVKSGIHFAAGIRGRFHGEVAYNIETLVNTLNELERNEDHPIYPFIGSWNSRLIGLAGSDFRHIRELRKRIEKRLQVWVQPDDATRGSYYTGLRRLQVACEHPLRVFSLNYDRCVEALGGPDFLVEGGFGVQANEKWAWRRFGDEALRSEPAQLYLYKLHGSINWKRDEHGDLTQTGYSGDNISALQIIFGREFKLEAADPYLLYVSEFRRQTMDARLVLIIGYSFSDDHINKMLRQAFRQDPGKRMLVVDHCPGREAESARAYGERVGVDAARVTVLGPGAKAFLESPEIFEQVRNALPPTPDGEF